MQRLDHLLDRGAAEALALTDRDRRLTYAKSVCFSHSKTRRGQAPNLSKIPYVTILTSMMFFIWN